MAKLNVEQKHKFWKIDLEQIKVQDIEDLGS